VELDGLKKLYETDCNMVMTNIKGEKVENINKNGPKTNAKRKER
jgi:hypothetical protein